MNEWSSCRSSPLYQHCFHPLESLIKEDSINTPINTDRLQIILKLSDGQRTTLGEDGDRDGETDPETGRDEGKVDGRVKGGPRCDRCNLLGEKVVT